jgi:hypothetical protein
VPVAGGLRGDASLSSLDTSGRADGGFVKVQKQQPQMRNWMEESEEEENNLPPSAQTGVPTPHSTARNRLGAQAGVGGSPARAE